MIDVDKLRKLAAALNRAEDKFPNPFYVGFGAAILEAIDETPPQWRPDPATGGTITAPRWPSRSPSTESETPA